MTQPAQSHPAPEREPQYHLEKEAVSGLERLVFFSDAVFAIAITLLALEVRLPGEVGALTDGQLLRALLAIWPKYLAYVISFIVIGSFWFAHHRKFRYIIGYDDRLLYINLLMLMTIAFIPFPTAVVSENDTSTATILYALTMVLCGLFSTWVWWYASRNNRLVAPNTDTAMRWRGLKRSLAVPAIFLLSIGLAFINSDLARYSWVLVLPATIAVRAS